jgi:hypothetical protein
MVMLLQTLSQICEVAQFPTMPETHSDFIALASDICDTTGENISCSTLKRLFGKVISKSAPSKAVLNIIARYIGYSDWEAYNESLYNGVSELIDFDIKEDGSCQYLCPENLQMGAVVEIMYEPESRVQLHFLGGTLFRVQMIKDCKLRIGDILDIRSIQVGSAIMGANIFRNGVSLGVGFRLANIKGGICCLRILNHK